MVGKIDTEWPGFARIFRRGGLSLTGKKSTGSDRKALLIQNFFEEALHERAPANVPVTDYQQTSLPGKAPDLLPGPCAFFVTRKSFPGAKKNVLPITSDHRGESP
jgi:hypothetical protein